MIVIIINIIITIITIIIAIIIIIIPTRLDISSPFWWENKPRRSLCVQAFSLLDDKDLDIQTQHKRMLATETHPAHTISEDGTWQLIKSFIGRVCTNFTNALVNRVQEHERRRGRCKSHLEITVTVY